MNPCGHFKTIDKFLRCTSPEQSACTIGSCIIQFKISKIKWIGSELSLNNLVVGLYEFILGIKHKILRLEWMVHSWDDLCPNSLNAKLIWTVKMLHARVLSDVEIKLNFHSISSIKSIHWYPNQNFRKPKIFEIFGPDKSSVHSFSVFYQILPKSVQTSQNPIFVAAWKLQSK